MTKKMGKPTNSKKNHMYQNAISSYEIVEILGDATPIVDPNATVVKGVLRTLMAVGDDEPHDGIDIRRYNRIKNISYNGIHLTMEEAHRVADILIENGFGSTEILEKELDRRHGLWKEKE